MLDDKDRIFTNLYGMHDRSLAGARARYDCRADEGLGVAGTRGRWLSDRVEMVVHAEAVGWAAVLSGGERR